MARFAAVLFLPILVVIVPGASAQTPEEFRCGPLVTGGYGPYDYRTATADQKRLVEGAHFTAAVEMLKSGTGPNTLPGPDIDYTLRAFPNHPRALKAMMELGARHKTPRPYGSRWTVDCYFNRAIRMAPDDAQVRMVYGIFLMRNGDKKGAIEQLEIAKASGASSGNFHYNLGLVYFQAQEYEKARQQAYLARELGYELEGLKNMLTKAGQWKEQPPKAAPPPNAESPAGESAQRPRS